MTKTIIITGATGNLGQAVAKQLNKEGYFMEAAIRGSIPDFLQIKNVHCEPLDLMDEQAVSLYVKDKVQKHREIKAAVLLVGGFSSGGIKEMNSAALDKMIGLNFKSAFHVVRPLMEQFEKQANGGKFIFIGARPGLEAKAGAGSVAYALSKSLIFKLSEFINEAGKDKEISATVVVPSIIDTPENRTAMPNADFSKWVTPSTLASVIASVLSSKDTKMQESVLKVYAN